MVLKEEGGWNAVVKNVLFRVNSLNLKQLTVHQHAHNTVSSSGLE